MKKLLIMTLAVSSVLTFSGCGGKDEVKHEENTVVNEKQPEVVEEVKIEVITETVTYAGTMSDINIHMTLNYYDDNRVEGTYYYDEYEENILLTGELVGSEISLKTTDGSEEFVGTKVGNKITGDWKSGDKTLPLNIEVDIETYGKSGEANILIDGEYIYYVGGDGYSFNIFRCKLDGSDNTKLAETSVDRNITSINDKIYYINNNVMISRMDKDGGNQEEIFNDIDMVYDFIIYKDRIYFDNRSQTVLDKEIPSKLFSVDLNGDDLKEVTLPKYTFQEDDSYLKSYSLSYIYKGYAYMQSAENGPDSDIYRIKLDGSDPQATGGLGYMVGCAYDRFYYMGVNSSEIYKRDIENVENKDTDFFSGENTYKNVNSEDENYTMNDKYFVYNYTMYDDDYHFISVVDLEGSIVNEIKVEKTQKTRDYQDESLTPIIIKGYIYFTGVLETADTGYLAKVEILGDEVEVITTFEN